MGKIRVKTLGDQEAEKKQKEEAKKRQEAKKAEKKAEAPVVAEAQSVIARNEVTKQSSPEQSTESAKSKKKKFSSKASHSASYGTVAQVVDPTRIYNLTDALALLPKLKRAKFDETVELHINTAGTGVTVSTVLPHGTGKTTRVAIANDQIIAEVEKGKINFDVLIAEPAMMPKLAKVARILGPKGLMPNPKNGTVTPKPEEVAKKYANGQVNFKTETKFPLLHLTVGKVSFGDQKLAENVKAIAEVLPANQVKNATLKLTMSPGIHVDYTSI